MTGRWGDWLTGEQAEKEELQEFSIAVSIVCWWWEDGQEGGTNKGNRVKNAEEQNSLCHSVFLTDSSWWLSSRTPRDVILCMVIKSQQAGRTQNRYLDHDPRWLLTAMGPYLLTFTLSSCQWHKGSTIRKDKVRPYTKEAFRGGSLCKKLWKNYPSSYCMASKRRCSLQYVLKVVYID